QKVDYYLVTTNAQRLADFAVSLTIQANTSIGTTPILLARDKDLPRAKKELSGFIENQPLQQDIQNRLLKLLARLPAANFERLRRILEPLHKQLQETILGQPALRVLLQRFARAWEQAVAGMQRFDWPAAQERLKEAAAQWKEACEMAPQMLGELARRSVACDLFLRWIAAGRISAFALTEPSAGSDTARVATRAVLRSAAVEREPDGALRFVPAGAREARYLVDAARLDFRADGVYYRWSEQAEPALLHFDEYDYESDDPARSPYYTHGPRTVHFSDVAQLREREGRLWYDYWELTGAKMWITNGRMAGVFCLYAKTAEGITGFMVDRHAEGLLVGKDEAKMGQLGSPTNELSLQAVRVPRENVLGLEGRGQVNALETLNVGRAGLAMSAMAQMEGLIDNSRMFAQQNPGNVPDWVAWRLERMEQNRCTAEALAHEVVGRFEHPGTKSVRMESAISKMVVSELLHETIELAEDIHGLPGQTELYLVEKRKRDARIINIYEGTNEIQRFFILKDLAGEVGARWSAGPAAVLPSYLGQEALALEALKGDFRQRLKAALDVFGEQLWQNPNLQANCFLLAEAAAWIKACDSTLGRLAWLEGRAYADDDAEPSPKADLARRAALRCHQEIRQRLAQFDEELVHLRRGFYAAEVRAASLLFNRTFGDDRSRQPASRITKPLSILVVVEPAPGPVPVPQVTAGRLMEPYLTLNDADRSALETALRLRDQATAAVTIEVAAVGPRGMAHALREALSQGVDRARLVLTDGEFVSPDSAARALAAVLAEGKAFDLVLGGWGEAGSSEGACARLLAAGLGLPHAGKAGHLVVCKDDAAAVAAAYDASGRRNWECALPVALAVEAGLPLRSFCMNSYLGGLASAVEVERWPKNLAAHKILFANRTSTVEPQAVDAPSASLTPQEAAEVMLDRLGISGNPTEPVQPFTGAIDELALPPDLDDGVVALLSSDAQGRLEPSAMAVLAAVRLVAGIESAGAFALVSVAADETSQRRLVRQVRQEFTGAIILAVSGEGERSPQTDSRVLSDCWALLTSQPRLVVGGPWAEDLLLSLARKGDRADPAVLRVRRLDLEEDRLAVETARNRGRLRVRQFLPGEQGMTCWLCLTAEAEVDTPLAPARLSGGVQRWRPRPGGVYGRDDLQRLLGDLKQATGLVSLADADFIIDVGFGIRNRDGYETVIEPLERALRVLGVSKVAIGGSRKVTDELHLLPPDRQIGQSGVSVNPQIILAIGISGAPQHLNYISPRAVILAFNRDPQAPIITLNQRQPRPRVYAIVGDLFEMVPAFTTALQQASPSETAPKCEDTVAAFS
ncbi:MAG TPA: acyl-CoA dehydrogenase family protein, partial [Gemmataceae bacterium]|nr:acyl-CoA dehydrogenase family protein [Gemmataceae bacterium]